MLSRTSFARRVALASAALTGIALLGSAPAQAATQTATPVCDNVCVLDVRSGAHADFDRVVIDLAGGRPVTRADESDSPSYVLPSGDVKDLQTPGSSYLFLGLQGAGIVDTTGKKVYTSPDVVATNLSAVKGVQRIPDSEGQVGFGLSLGSHSRYSVFTLTAPDRVVVDVYR
ncbi:hypothetical protein ACGFZL_01590 [Streptomyces sp. NPDC048182]|uniref:AMIN-like domain-containing (lipo)protein n=1 Tax=Streptomyces sp. NPDC048182 TaxID=3365507 RepID=UPI00371FE415